MNASPRIAKAVQSSPDLMKLLVDSAVEFLSNKHSVPPEDVRAAYLAGAPVVREQVLRLVAVGWREAQIIAKNIAKKT